MTVAGNGLRVSSVDDRGQRLQVDDGVYEYAIAHKQEPNGARRWQVTLFLVGTVPAPAGTPARTRTDTPAGREKRRTKLLERLADRQNGNDLSNFKLENGYNELLDELAPSLGGRVNLYRTGITQLPDWLRKCPMLSELLAHDNQLTSLPDWLPELHGLQRLTLAYNHGLRSLPDVIATVPRLLRLELDETGLTEFPAVLRFMPRLQRLSIMDTAITELPTWIGEMRGLRQLYLDNVPLASLPDSIGDLPNLEKLYLQNTALTSLPDTLVNLPNLKAVALDGSPITHIPAAVIDHFPDGVISDGSTPFGRQRRRKR